MKAIFVCAGTGGHINPAIAIANEIKKRQKDSEIIFIGTKNGLENDLVKKAGYKIKHINTGKLIRAITFKNFKAVIDTYKGISEAKKIIAEFKPDIVIGTGGYICGPVMVAAKNKKIPYVLHESNAFPGVTVKLLAKNAAKVLVGFEDAKKRLKNRKNVVFTGTPTKFNKENIDKLDKEKCMEEFNIKNINKKIIGVMCGSQGAKKINEVVLEMLEYNLSKKEDINEDIYIILVTGNKNYDEILSKVNQLEKKLNIDLSKYISVQKYIYEMEKMYKIVDLLITRAGAMTITELQIINKNAILIPLPTAAENHQLYNAKVLENLGIGTIIEQKDLNYITLLDTINLKLKNVKDIEGLDKNNKKNIDNVDSNKVLDNIYKCIRDVLN